VHEAGHAVGRFLTAPRLGFDCDDAISHIDIHVTDVWDGYKSFDGRMMLPSQATTFGPMFSRELDAFFLANVAGDGAREVPCKEAAGILVKARAAGLDVDGWFRAKGLTVVFGPMAEAKFSGKPFEDVWDDYSAESDMMDLVRHGFLAGLLEQIETVEREIVDNATREIARPEVWRAILSVADILQPGRTDGRKVAAIIAAALESSGRSRRSEAAALARLVKYPHASTAFCHETCPTTVEAASV
jgi:hypothetical protein